MGFRSASWLYQVRFDLRPPTRLYVAPWWKIYFHITSPFEKENFWMIWIMN